MIEQLMAMEGYDKDKNYVVAKHSDRHVMILKGRMLAGEIPDASGEQNGTMQVWEIPDPTKIDVNSILTAPYPNRTIPVVDAVAASVSDVLADVDKRHFEDLPPVVEPQKPSRLKRALKKLSKKGTK